MDNIKTRCTSGNGNLLHFIVIISVPYALVLWFCPGVLVHKGIAIVLSLFRGHWLAVVYCLVFFIGPCEPVYEDKTPC